MENNTSTFNKCGELSPNEPQSLVFVALSFNPRGFAKRHLQRLRTNRATYTWQRMEHIQQLPETQRMVLALLISSCYITLKMAKNKTQLNASLILPFSAQNCCFYPNKSPRAFWTIRSRNAHKFTPHKALKTFYFPKARQNQSSSYHKECWFSSHAENRPCDSNDSETCPNYPAPIIF